MVAMLLAKTIFFDGDAADGGEVEERRRSKGRVGDGDVGEQRVVGVDKY